jgi:SSS family solute:Na+ symporter
MRSMVFTMPEFLERRFSTASRYVLSVVSLITFVVSKIAVGIFAGGVVFSTLLPELQLTIGTVHVNSFWLGSILVIVLTGLYTSLGGMRAVAYNDAVQVTVLIVGSALLTIYGLIELGGWSALRAALPSEMFNLWKPLIPAGVQGTWAPVLETDAAGRVVREAWYFNGNFPWLGMAVCAPIIGLWYWCTDQYIVQRALGAPDEQTARRGTIFAAILKLLPVYLFIIPGLVCFALAKSGKVPGLAPGGTGRAARAACRPGGVPAHGRASIASRAAGIVVANLSALMGRSRVYSTRARRCSPWTSTRNGSPATQHQIVRTGRLATAAMILVAIAWIPVFRADGLYNISKPCRAWRRPSSSCSFSASFSNVSTRKAAHGRCSSVLRWEFFGCWSTPRSRLALQGTNAATRQDRSCGSSTTSTFSISASSSRSCRPS